MIKNIDFSKKYRHTKIIQKKERNYKLSPYEIAGTQSAFCPRMREGSRDKCPPNESAPVVSVGREYGIDVGKTVFCVNYIFFKQMALVCTYFLKYKPYYSYVNT